MAAALQLFIQEEQMNLFKIICLPFCSLVKDLYFFLIYWIYFAEYKLLVEYFHLFPYEILNHPDSNFLKI